MHAANRLYLALSVGTPEYEAKQARKGELGGYPAGPGAHLPGAPTHADPGHSPAVERDTRGQFV